MTPTGAGDEARPLPGWTIPVRLALVVGAFAGGLHLLASVGHGAATDVATLVRRTLAGALLTVLVVGLLVLLLRLTGRRSLGAIGLTGPVDSARDFLRGLVAWLIPATLSFGVLALLGAPLRVTAPTDRVWTVVALLLLAVLLSEAIPEELVFRGYVTAVLAERLRAWWVIAVQALLFTVTAVVVRGGVGLLDLSMFITMGFVLGYFRLVTASVWTTIGFHLAFQTGSQLVLTHDVVSFAGSPTLAMLALGAVPFTAGVLYFSLRPLGRRPRGRGYAGAHERPAGDPDRPRRARRGRRGAPRGRR